jgi:hypothetical protein
MLYVTNLKVNLLSVVDFEDEGYAVAFHNGHVLVYSREATQDATIVLGVRNERLYRLLGRPIIGSNGFMDSASASMSYLTSPSEGFSDIGTYETPSIIKGGMSP